MIERFLNFFAYLGYSRAAHELTRLGYEKEAKEARALANENLRGWV